MCNYRGILAGVLLVTTLGTTSAAALTGARLGPSVTAITAPVRGSAVAYDPANHVYLVVSAYGALNGQFVGADGTLIGGPFAIPTSTAFSHYPRVAYSPDADAGSGAFLVTWHQSDLAGTPFTSVHGRLVSFTRGIVSPDRQISIEGAFWEQGPNVAYSTTSKEFLVTWNGAGIRAQRVSNTGENLGAVIGVSTPVAGWGYRDPTLSYNRDTNEYLIVYSGWTTSYAFVAARRVAAGTGAVMNDQTVLNTAVGTYITDSVYNPVTKKYLAAWYQGGTFGRLLNSDGTIASDVFVLATRFTAYDALGIDYNVASGTYMMVSHDILSLQDGAVELNASAVPDGVGFIATDVPTTLGNYYPEIAARSDKAEWLMSTATSFASTTVQRLQSSSVGGTLAPLPLTASIRANTAMPVVEGTTITWTAATSGGTGPFTYQFWRYSSGSGWSIAQDYSATNTYSWAPSAGSHAVQVYVRNAGSTATYNSYAESGLFNVTVPRAKLVSLTSNVSFPSAPNVPITFTAVSSGGVAPNQYQFWRFTQGTGWAMVQDYSSTNTYTWYPVAGTYAVQVWVRGSGSTASYEDYGSSGLFAIASTPARLTGLTANRAFPASPSAAITWTASASGGNGPLEYKFWIFSAATGWTVLRDWAAGNQATWTAGIPGTGQHALQVWVRTQGSGLAFEDWRGTDWFLITDSTSLAFTPSLNVNNYSVGNGCVLFTATTGGPGTWEYQFWTYGNSTWTLSQTYSSAYNTFNYCPTAGTHAVQVWTRQAGSTGLWERWASTGFFVVNP
jgi:hypothetical protein